MTKPYADMSYDELNAYVESAEASPTSIAEATEEMQRKSAVMTAICKLAAELDSEGWVLVPRRIIGSGLASFGYPPLIYSSPEAAILNHGETA